ncbi:MAG: cysteine--tRNA ligase [Candidatus Omnitrophota bacterium]|nr:cysteine--tRNA ligase [Candidatus Omnitrophota bacterium]
MKIYNSLTRTKEEFVPINKKKIGMYVCGPTVYDEPHIGHARSAYIFDVIRRYLSGKYEVTFVRNVTDVDDKIIDKARKELGAGSSELGVAEKVKEVAKKYLDAYHEDMTLLGIGRPDKEPKATEYIPKMIKFIEGLIEKDCAYGSDGDVYFDIKKAKSYGKLSNQNIDKMEIGARISPGEKKKDPLDFALWKKAKEGEPSWESPWGAGRPGWHIECSAMSSDMLGDEFDIHGGGIDLIFPHHENEIAQSEGAGKAFARYWIHNGLLTIDNEKMAKSLGNFISIKDFMLKYKDADYLKLLFLNTHYRHPVDYTEERIQEMKAQKERFVIMLDKIDRSIKVHGPQSMPCRQAGTVHSPVKELEGFRARFGEAMDDDFNMPLALSNLFELVNFTNKKIDDPNVVFESKKMLLELVQIFGLNLEQIDKDLPDKVETLIKERDEARAKKDYKRSDDIRKKLSGMGVILEDTKEGTVWRKEL